MAKEEAIRRMLKAARISEENLSLTERLLDLEDKTEKVISVTLNYRTPNCSGPSAEVVLNTNFSSLDDFKEYLASNNIKPDSTWQDEKGDYMLRASHMPVKFLVNNTYHLEE